MAVVVAVASELQKDIDNLNSLIRNIPNVTKRVAVTMLAVTSDRIFNQGLDANNRAIGRYSKGYVKTRKRRGLGSSTKVVLTLTGQMQNDFSVVQQGSDIGLGFKNQVNADKAGYVQETYNKQIFEPTDKEERQAVELFIKFSEQKL